MAGIPGVNIAAAVVPYDTAETHPTHLAQYGKGGWRSCQSLSERDTIPASRRELGMIVFVLEDGKAYQLQGSSEQQIPGVWTEYIPGLVTNATEPQSSVENPNPSGANYFLGDDYVYHRVGGIWKRSAHLEF